MANDRQTGIAILWRGDREARATATPRNTRLKRIFEELAARDIPAEPAVYAEEFASAVREQLLGVRGVLVWVDPISNDRDRSALDPLLREIASRGVWVSTHPDVILKMGVKEVLYRTRQLGWGTDTQLYETPGALRERFPHRLSGGARVLKQNRGNGGIGVWRVEAEESATGRGLDMQVKVLHARRDSVEERMRLSVFFERCEIYFAGGGRIVDQPFQPRLGEGMIRCYCSAGAVVGYGHQLIKALLPIPPEQIGTEAAQPGPRIMHGPGAPAFQALRRKMEDEWIPGTQRILGIDTEQLPAIWDADFLYGPKTANGEDTYVLCEINVSSCFPLPDEAPAKIAEWVSKRLAR